MNPNFTELVERAGLTEADLARLAEAIALDYPADPMMQEIRLVRSLHAVADEKLTLSDLLEDMRADQREREASVARLTKN